MEESTKGNVVDINATTKCEHCGGPKQRVRALTAQISELEDKLAQAKLTTEKVMESCQEYVNRMQIEAFSERNCLLAALSKIYPSGWGIDGNAEKENPKWKYLVFIEFPKGECVWSFHESDKNIFKHLAPYTKEFKGALTNRDKYKIVLADPQKKSQLILPGHLK